jgi:hypothetical protein
MIDMGAPKRLAASARETVEDSLRRRVEDLVACENREADKLLFRLLCGCQCGREGFVALGWTD